MSNDYVRHVNVKRYSGRRLRRNPGPLIALVLLLLAVFAGTLAALAKEEKMEEENRPQTVTDTPVPSPTPEISPTQAASKFAAGAFGLWEPTNTPTPTVYIPPGEEIWMADWVDTRTEVKSKGIYVSSMFTVNLGTDAERVAAFDRLLELVDRTELNTMVVDVKYDSGAILYNFDSELIRGYDTLVPGKKIIVEHLAFLPEYIKKLHEHGVYLVARLVAFKDDRLVAVRPDLAIYNKNGKLYADKSSSHWVSPYKQEVWEYLAEVGRQCAGIGFDEINFDYIRFPTDNISNVDWGPESETTTKTEAITNGVRYLCEQLRACNVYVSADVYGIVMSSPLDASNVGQDFAQMALYMDYLCPMVYPSHYDKSWVSTGDWPDLHPYEVVSKSLGYGVSSISKIPVYKHCAKIRPWLQDFTADYLGTGRYMVYDADAVAAQISAAYDNGCTGWLLWNAKGIFTEDALEHK